jgi:hypothetical protein
MSIINKPPEMVKREYELQEPIAVAVEKYATFIQSTPDHVVDSALKIVIGEMWSSAAGASNSRRRLRERISVPRQRQRGHDPTNPPFEALPRLPPLGGHGNGALLPDAIPGRQYLSPGHGHPLGVGLPLLQVLLHPLPPYNAIHRLFGPAFRHLHFRPQGRPLDPGRQNASLSRPPEEDRTFSRSGRGTSPPQASPFGNVSGNEAFSRGSPSWVRSAREKRQAACSPSPSRSWRIAPKTSLGGQRMAVSAP